MNWETPFKPEGCQNCGGEGWVCENHPDSPWDGVSGRRDACGCGAGMPCGVCAAGLACAGRVEGERERIIEWLKSWDKHYSGWNDHDEWFDDGYNSAVQDVIVGLTRREHAASATEAGTDETRSGSAEGEGAVAKPDAQTPPRENEQ